MANVVRRAALVAAVLAGSVVATGAAYAYDATPAERAELQKLSPQLRQKVEARMVSGQTLNGILETMLLNNLSQDFASGKIVATDWQRGEIVVENKGGQVRAFPFDVATLQIKQ